MKQHEFEQLHQGLWQTLEECLANPKQPLDKHFPQQYRQLCQHLAVAKSRLYTRSLINRLNNLVVECHHILYRHNTLSEQKWLWFLVYGFPQAIRSNLNFVVTAAVLFLLPLLILGIGCYTHSELIYSVINAETVASFEAMYDPQNRSIGRERDSEEDIAMFGHYIQNNIGIGFRTFASGIVFGLGSVFVLVFNGITIGSVAGYLTQAGYEATFYQFVVGHGAFELTAIVFCGAAGLKIGFSLLAPGRFTRLQALKIASRQAVVIVYGSALMLLIAAFIEAFWSSSQSLPLSVKYSFGAAWAVLLTLYFSFSGKRYEPR
ncbi:stage II sporulation protein M [Halioxenophilus aromaticivorans]|uniref:Stage II sporulation protein M n=1 Tax=Halioxenophilus aromaticivorans TaxID=1306992 RepID=A0AAV3U3P5_9ALTE